jgi:hypothetical protein
MMAFRGHKFFLPSPGEESDGADKNDKNVLNDFENNIARCEFGRHLLTGNVVSATIFDDNNETISSSHDLQLPMATLRFNTNVNCPGHFQEKLE